MSPLACPIQRPQVPTISQADYRNLRQAALPHALLDVREADEWQAGHIDGAMHVALATLEERYRDVLPDPHQQIVVYCASGGRSAAAVYFLQQQGYDHVQNLEGGWLAWQLQGIA